MASSVSGQDETKSLAVIGYPSGQNGVILPARDCPFCSRNNISPKSKRVHENFLLQNIFIDSKKIFCDFCVGMERENRNALSLLLITGFLFSARK